MRKTLAIALLACACAQEIPTPEAATGARAPDRETWWEDATSHPSGRERILAPRELKALLEEGLALGFHADADWWNERRKWVAERVLELDPTDPQANEAAGRKILQETDGFDELWVRILEARAQSDAITELLDQYGDQVHQRRPIFLFEDEYQVVRAKLKEAAAHLQRLEDDPRYAAVQVALARVRGSVLSDYPFIHVAAGPFLVFYSAPDLRRVVGDDEATENRRIAALVEIYRKRLAGRAEVLTQLLEDFEELYPKAWKTRGFGPKTIFYQWIFADRTQYAGFLEALNKSRPESKHRVGFFDRRTHWAYMFEPSEPEVAEEDRDPAAQTADPEQTLRETAAYLGALQVLYRWAKDRKDPSTNHLHTSHAYWFLEGLPSFLASRRVQKPLAGHELAEGVRFGRRFPPLHRIVERKSRIELFSYREPDDNAEHDEERPPQMRVVRYFTDLSWLLVRHFHREEHLPAFRRYLLTQIEGTQRGIAWFEKCFGLDSEQRWQDLARAVYAGIK